MKKRDQALDLIRGGCILLMTFAHLAPDSRVTWVLHLPLWVDGASGFVLLAGVVLGMIQHRRIADGGLAGAERLLARRAGLLYGAHVALVLAALALASVFAVTAPWYPHAEDEGGPGAAVIRSLMLQVNPQSLDILSMYVVLLILAMGAVALLKRGLVLVLVAITLAVYVVAQLAPEWTTLPAGLGQPGFFSWGGWQLIFLSGFIAGWYWKQARLAERLTTWRATAVGAAVVLVLYAIFIPVVYGDVAPVLRPLAERQVAKGTAGPVMVLVAGGAFVVLYGVMTRLVALTALLAPLQTVGRHGLDSYLTLTIVVLIAPLFAGRVPTGWEAVALTCAALLTMWVWARAKESRKGSRTRSVAGPGA